MKTFLQIATPGLYVLIFMSNIKFNACIPSIDIGGLCKMMPAIFPVFAFYAVQTSTLN